MGVETRKKSLLSGCETEELFRLEQFPIHMMQNDKTRCIDMIYEIGKDDGFIQVKNVVTPDELYVDTHSNAIGKVWQGAHIEVANIIAKYSNENTELLEIGGATGRLNVEFNKIGVCKKWNIIEPQPCPVEECTATFIKGFFPDDINNSRKYDVVVHTHVWEHSEDLKGFISNIRRCLSLGGRMIFSVPDMKYMFEKNVTSIINFEHSFMLFPEHIEYLLDLYGFEILEKKSYGNGHSLIYSTILAKDENSNAKMPNLYEKNKDYFMKYINYHIEMVNAWNLKIEREKRPIYLFGAHISTQYFSSYGLKMNKIVALLDNDKTKQGKKVGGLDKEILSPQILQDKGEVVVIIPNNPYKEKIKENIRNCINSSVEFWE